MKRYPTYLLWFGFAIACSVLWACGGSKNASEGSAAQDFSAAPTPTSSFNFNGVQILHQRTDGPLVSVGLVFGGRHTREDSTLSGLENLLMQMLIHGGTHYRSPHQVKVRAEAVGARFSTEVQPDHSLLTMQCPADEFENAWRLLGEMIFEPAFLPPVFGRLLSGAQERMQLRAKDSLYGPIERAVGKSLYYAHPYRLPLKGTPASLNRMRYDALFVYYDRMLTATNIKLVVVGNVSRATIADNLIGTFDQLLQEPTRALPDVNWENVPEPVLMPDSTLPEGRFYARVPGPNVYDAEAVQLELALLCLKSAVQAELCQQRQLTCDFDAELLYCAHQGAEWRFTTPVPHQTIGYFLNILKRIVESGPYERELAAAKAQLKYRVFAPRMKQLAHVQQLSAMLSAFGSPGLVAKPAEMANTINLASAKDIQRVARKYFSNPLWYYHGNPRKMNAQLFSREAG
ncbi:MAG: M16 family metallopeptidase [Bacteroidota bacterium]